MRELKQAEALQELSELLGRNVQAQKFYLETMGNVKSESSKSKLLAGLRYHFTVAEQISQAQKGIVDGVKFSPEWELDKDESLLCGLVVHMPGRPLSFTFFHFDFDGRVAPMDSPAQEVHRLLSSDDSMIDDRPE